MKYKFFLAVLFSFSFILISVAHPFKNNGIAHPTYALIISIGSYAEQPSWPKVNSREDADNIEYFIKRFASDPIIDILRDEQATKKNIVNSLNAILKNAGEGDAVYLHFSGGGFQLQTDTLKQVFMPFDAPSVEDVTDAVMNNKTPDLSYAIIDYELINIIQRIRKKIGVSGQCFFTMDASHFGPKNSNPQSILGRGGFLQISDSEAGLSPFIMITSCLNKEESYFVGDKEPLQRSFSLAIKKYCSSLKLQQLVKYSNLFSGIKQQMAIIAPGQTPAIAGVVERNVLGGVVTTDIKIPGDKKSNNISRDSRLFILSIGISNYTAAAGIFSNCSKDAELFADKMNKSFLQQGGGVSKTWLLLDRSATKDSIIKAINQIINEAKDDDVFAFFFAGLTNQPLNKNGQYEETWFYPSISKMVSPFDRSGINESDVLSLQNVKKLFDYIKCDKQLLFTEAGPSENFKREFVKSMIKSNPVISDIRKRNRVIIVPDGIGLDDVNCNGKIDHGPGLYFFTLLIDNNANIFDLFSDVTFKRENVVYEFRNQQFKCSFKRQYINFFFEKQFVEDLQYYFTKDVSLKTNTRGAGENETDDKDSKTSIGNKYALVIGTDKFSTWNQLQNPVNDAFSVADTLSGLFGFKTTVLKNPTLKQIYNSLYAYRNILQENDQFLLYLAGHGYYDSTIFRDGFIVTADSKALWADTFLTSYIPFNQLRNITDNYRAKQIIVLLDVCFSGAFSDNDESLGGNINYNLTGRLTDKTLGKKLQMTTRKYITAGSKTEEVGDDYNGQHSPFAYFLLEGLRRAAKEKKYLSSGMLYKFIQSYLEDTVPLQAGFGKDQEKSGSEFIFIAK
ncbi:MAG: hypothetical protein JWN83_2141 [Chitinophagaceae bacterium]|nr:hypothetical protein [Chitinophagaceae bacterium]